MHSDVISASNIFLYGRSKIDCHIGVLHNFKVEHLSDSSVVSGAKKKNENNTSFFEILI